MLKNTMEWLLSLLTKPRYLLCAAALVLALRYQSFFTGNFAKLYRQWRYPPQGEAPAAGADILKEIDEQASRKVAAKYRAVTALLDKAAAKGANVGALRAQADRALAYNAPGSRKKALDLLSEIAGKLPRQGPRYAPADPSEDDLLIPQDASRREVATGGRALKRKAARKKGGR
ncbi:MAG: hypothetical protein HY921_00570 [Elusimicrobia bacterium]|nr:hypothetical protein [Elusimicrobiota bacterium]